MAFGGYLQANTAVDLMVGPFVDETNGKDAEIGLTITQAEVRLSKNGANIAQKAEATSLVHDELGNYVCKLDTTDTNTEGVLTLMIHESGALPIKMDYMVLAQAAYISLVTAKDTGFMDVDIKAISTDTTAADNLELFTEVLENATGLIDAGTFKAGAIDAAAIADAAIDNATFAADVGSTAYATNIIALAVRKVLDELNLDHLLKVDTTVAADGDLEAYCVAGTIIAHLLSTSADATLYKASTDSQQGIRDHIGDGTNLTEAGGDGDHLTAINLPNQTMDITGNLSGSVGSVTGHTNQTGDNFAIVNGTAGLVAIDTVVDAIKVITDALTAAGAAKLALGATTMITGTVSWDNTNATTTVIYSDDITEATADHFNGRLFVPTSGALVGQYTDITDYSLDTGEGKFSVTALTEAPADNTTFMIL